MTEAEWLSTTKPHEVLSHPECHCDRKRRLLACAAARRVLEAHSDPRLAAAVAECELFADKLIDWPAMLNLRMTLAKALREMTSIHADPNDTGAVRTIQTVTGAKYEQYITALDIAQQWRGNRSRDFTKGCAREEAAQLHLARDIFGNPFRPVACDPAWRTSTAVALAQQMYDSRDFSLMPILADALQDAGCDSNDLLTHCRDANAAHVRGCWVVDLVLAKN